MQGRQQYDISLTRSESGPIINAARLVTPQTLRKTIAMSKSESVWSLMHRELETIEEAAPPPAVISDFRQNRLETIAEMPLIPLRDLSPQTNRSSSCLRSLPTDKDFLRIQNRLTKLSTGFGLTLRAIILPEGKTLELRLEQEEWQYMKVRLAGKPVPLEITQKRQKGKLNLFLSKTVTEPSQTFCDEVHRKEIVHVTEPGLKFKSEWLYLGFYCLEDVFQTISIRFGSNTRDILRRNKGLSLLDDLDDFRRDDSLRISLDFKVNGIRTKRKKLLAEKYSARNFLAENKKVKRTEDLQKEEKEELHRSQVYERSFQLSEARRQKAEESLQRQARRKAEREQAAMQSLLYSQQQCREKTWLSLLSFSQSAFSLQSRFQSRKSALAEIKKQTISAMVIQRCYQQAFKLNPKRAAVSRAAHSIKLCCCHLFLIINPPAKILKLIRDSFISSVVRRSISNFQRKIMKMQSLCRGFATRKSLWRQRIISDWQRTVVAKAESPEGKRRKKAAARKNKEERSGKTDPQSRDVQIQALWMERKRQFRDDLQKFRENSGEEVAERPSFRWKVSEEDLGEMIRKAGGAGSG